MPSTTASLINWCSEFFDPFRVSYWDKIFYDPKIFCCDVLGLFFRRVESFVNKDSVVLDLGAGAGELNSYDLKGKVKRIVGIDLDERVMQNPLLDQGYVADCSNLPFPDSSIDVIFAVYVLEHVQDPLSLVREVKRVLKPGGVFIALTPSKFHYVSIIASLTPTWFHGMFNRLNGRTSRDTFPTWYRMNSRKSVQRLLRDEFGFDEIFFELREFSPYYLRFTLPTYLIGVVYERLVNKFAFLCDLRVNLFFGFRKP